MNLSLAIKTKQSKKRKLKQEITNAAAEKNMNSLALLIGMKISIAIMENNMEAPQQKRNGIHNIQLSHFWTYMQKK